MSNDRIELCVACEERPPEHHDGAVCRPCLLVEETEGVAKWGELWPGENRFAVVLASRKMARRRLACQCVIPTSEPGTAGHLWATYCTCGAPSPLAIVLGVVA